MGEGGGQRCSGESEPYAKTHLQHDTIDNLVAKRQAVLVENLAKCWYVHDTTAAGAARRGEQPRQDRTPDVLLAHHARHSMQNGNAREGKNTWKVIT